MWAGFDPELLRQLATIRQMVALRYRTPTREWPLVVDQDVDQPGRYSSFVNGPTDPSRPTSPPGPLSNS